MKGKVDASNRALLTVAVRSNLQSDTASVEAWIDTAFDGHFVFSSALIKELGLETLAETEALLADGTKVALETFVGYLDWFDEVVPVQVVANKGHFPLLGTELLKEHRLAIDYRAQTVDVS